MVSKLTAWTLSQSAQEIIASLLESDEQEVIVAPFEQYVVSGEPLKEQIVPSGSGLMVVSNRYLRMVNVRGSWSKRKPMSLQSYKQVPLQQISAVRVTDNSEILQIVSHARVLLSFVGPEGEQFYRSTMHPAPQLAWELQRQVAAVAASGSRGSVASELAVLGELRQHGLLTDWDWERAKELFLGKAPTERERTVGDLKQLHSLAVSGVLTADEYQKKKWEVLGFGVVTCRNCGAPVEPAAIACRHCGSPVG